MGPEVCVQDLISIPSKDPVINSSQFSFFLSFFVVVVYREVINTCCVSLS